MFPGPQKVFMEQPLNKRHNIARQRKMILSMGAGQLDLLSHSLIITLSYHHV